MSGLGSAVGLESLRLGLRLFRFWGVGLLCLRSQGLGCLGLGAEGVPL